MNRSNFSDDDDDAPLAPPATPAVPVTRKKRKTVQQPSASTPVRKKRQPAKKEENEINDKVRANFKEGQRIICPPVGDGTRAFYESLLKEKPWSVAANKWCIEHGVLIGTSLKRQLIRYYVLKEMGAFRSPGGIHEEFIISESDVDRRMGAK